MSYLGLRLLRFGFVLFIGVWLLGCVKVLLLFKVAVLRLVENPPPPQAFRCCDKSGDIIG